MDDPLVNESLIEKAKSKAALYGLDPALVCAVCEQESGWDCWAMRYEPAFFVRYIAHQPNLTDTERQARATSWGLMQVMGEVARELGFSHKFLAMLCDPDICLTVGCNKLSKCLAAAGGVEAEALMKWNGGGNPEYAMQVLARKEHYQ